MQLIALKNHRWMERIPKEIMFSINVSQIAVFAFPVKSNWVLLVLNSLNK